jgi:hypothetical protein
MTKKKNSIGRIFSFLFLKLIPFLLVFLLILYTIVFALAVRHKINIWQSNKGGSSDSSEYSRKEWGLIRDKTFLKARIELAGNDSIGMTINLQDSLVQLENKGVVLRQVKFDKAEVSRFFKALHPTPYARIFSKPIKINEIEGSIVKEPITVKKAPRDSLEAARNASATVDTSQVEFIEWHLKLDTFLTISFVQSDNSLGNTNWEVWEYRLRQHYKTLSGTIQALIQLKRPAYYPEITIFIPKKEAKSIYRALPPNGLVALRF